METQIFYFIFKKVEIEFQFVFWLLSKCWNHLSFVNVSPSLVMIHQWAGLHEYYGMETQQCDFLLKKRSKWNSDFNFDLIVPKCWNHPSFVNLSPTVVNDTSMEKSSPVLLHRNPKFRFSFQKRSKLNFNLYFDLCRSAWITLASSLSVLQ